MKYKVGDKVKIKSIDWYHENKDRYGSVPCGKYCFVPGMSAFCGKILTINYDFKDKTYLMKEDNNSYIFTNEMIEGLVEEEIITANGIQLNQSNTSLEKEMEWNLPQGYQFKDENGNIINATKIVLEKIKKEYPKTYEECCKILLYSGNYNMILTTDVDNKIFNALYRLKVCRDAYWKIYGKEMKLGKSWKPDWKDFEQLKYCIWVDVGDIILNEGCRCQHILTFPTIEMRDAFYENFKKDIEECKELL